MIRSSITSLALIMALGSTCLGQATLQLKVKEGSRKVQTVTGIDQLLTIAGMPQDSKTENVTTVTVKTGQRGADGTVKVTEKIDSMQLTTTMLGQEYSFDSANPDNKGASQLEILRPLHKAILKSETVQVFGKDNRVEEVSVDQNLLATLPPEAKMLAEGQLNGEYLKTEANQGIDRLPTGAVNKGDTWNRTEVANFGGGQIMTFKKTYTYDGTVDQGGKKLHKVSSKTTDVEFSLANDSPLPLSLKSSELKVDESGGHYLFDSEAGQFVETKDDIKLEGTLGFEINGMELPATLVLTMKVETTRP